MKTVRIDEALNLIQQALNASGQLHVNAVQRFNGQAYQVNNWQTLRAALKELLRQNWIPNSELIQDFVEVEGIAVLAPLLEGRVTMIS